MKTFIVFCVVAVLGCNAQFGSTGGFPEYKLDSLNRYMQDRRIAKLTDQLEDACPGSKTKFEDSLDSFKNCVNEIDEFEETSCSIAQNHMSKCMKPMIKVFDDCLPEESRGIPQMFLDGLISSTKYLCKTDGEHVFELNNACVYKTSYKSERCFRMLRTKLQKFRTQVPTKQEVCDAYEAMKPCWTSHINNACGHPVTKETWLRFFDELGAPCRPYLTSKNSVYELKNAEVESF